MSNTPCRRTFSRNALAAYVQERIRELDEKIDALRKGLLLNMTTARRMELRRLYDHFNLGKDRRRPQRGTLGRYDAK